MSCSGLGNPDSSVRRPWDGSDFCSGKEQNMIEVWSLEEAWREACRQCISNGYVYTIERGSYAGQQRKQLPYFALLVRHPEMCPLVPLTQGLSVATDKSIFEYFVHYLLNPEKGEDEDYTYSERLMPHLNTLIAMLKETPSTNQATIEIARPEDILLESPPCLRVLSWKVVDGKLWLTSFWRSWDLYAALPVNLGGLQLLNEMVAEATNLESGPQVAYSDGAHIYDHFWSFLTGLNERFR